MVRAANGAKPQGPVQAQAQGGGEGGVGGGEGGTPREAEDLQGQDMAHFSLRVRGGGGVVLSVHFSLRIRGGGGIAV